MPSRSATHTQTWGLEPSRRLSRPGGMIWGSDRGRSGGPWSDLVMPEHVGQGWGNAMGTCGRTKPLTVSPLLRRGPPRAAVAEAAIDIVDHHLLEVGRDRRAAQGHRLLAVDEDGRRRALTGAGKRDANVGVLALARPVHDAAHHRDVERLHAGIALLPLRHRLMDEALDVARELLERGRGGTPAARTGRHQRHEGAEAHGLQQFL